MFKHGSPPLLGGTTDKPLTQVLSQCEDGHIARTRSVVAIQPREESGCMRQKLSIVLVVIAALLVVGAKVVAPKPGSTRSYFTGVKTAVPSGMKSFPNELLPQ